MVSSFASVVEAGPAGRPPRPCRAGSREWVRRRSTLAAGARRSARRGRRRRCARPRAIRSAFGAGEQQQADIEGVAEVQARRRKARSRRPRPSCTSTAAACSREEPMPKFGPATITSPARTPARELRAAPLPGSAGRSPRCRASSRGPGASGVGVHVGAQAPDAGMAARSVALMRGSCQHLARIGDHAAQRRSRDGVGRAQIHLRRGRAHAAPEIARGAGDDGGVVGRCCRHSRRKPRRRWASSCAPASSSDLQHALAPRRLLVLQAGGRDHQPHVAAATRRPRSTCGRGAQVVELGAGAGADVGHVDRRARVVGPRPARWPGCAAPPRSGSSAAASKRWVRSPRCRPRPRRCAGRRCPRPARRCAASHCAWSSSGAIRPACAPSSALMLASVMRSGIDSACTALPQNSTAWYAPPFMPKRPIMCSIMSLAHDAAAQPAVPLHADRLRARAARSRR